MSLHSRVSKWFLPISEDRITLHDAFVSMQEIGFEQEDIPLIVQLVENPKFDLPGIDIFNGATGLECHDYIHLILGRGLLPKDEAFVLGFTMGSTNRVRNLEEALYGLFSRFLYPKEYRFDNDDFQVYKDAVRLGYVSDCTPLDSIKWHELQDLSLREAREKLGVEVDLLKAYYQIEAKRYPQSLESQRLLK